MLNPDMTAAQVQQRKAEKLAALQVLKQEIVKLEAEYAQAAASGDDMALSRAHKRRSQARERMRALQDAVTVLDSLGEQIAAEDRKADHRQRLAAQAAKGQKFIKQGDRVQAVLDELLVEFGKLSDLGQEYLQSVVVPYEYGELPTLPIGDHRLARAIMLELYAKSDGRFALPSMGASPWQVRQAPSLSGRIREAVQRAEARQRRPIPEHTPPAAA